MKNRIETDHYKVVIWIAEAPVVFGVNRANTDCDRLKDEISDILYAIDDIRYNIQVVKKFDGGDEFHRSWSSLIEMIEDRWT